MAVKGGYQRPTSTSFIPSSWADHKRRNPPSQEPGTDYASPYGSPVYAPESGVIADLKTSSFGPTGRYVTVDLDDGQRTRSIHLSRVIVARGQRVRRGQIIAYSGASANGSNWGVGPHVHQTLWPTHAYVWGPYGTLDFERFVGADNDAAPANVPSANVKGIQRSLNLYGGASLKVDGLLGPKTVIAIKAFQKKHRLTVDGVWGPLTNSAMNQARNAAIASRRATIKQGNTGTLVKIVQRKLNIRADGIFGPKTEAAVTAYQKRQKLVADGVVGPKTWARLGI